MVLRIKTTSKIRPLLMARMVVLFLKFHCNNLLSSVERDIALPQFIVPLSATLRTATRHLLCTSQDFPSGPSGLMFQLVCHISSRRIQYGSSNKYVTSLFTALDTVKVLPPHSICPSPHCQLLLFGTDMRIELVIILFSVVD